MTSKQQAAPVLRSSLFIEFNVIRGGGRMAFALFLQDYPRCLLILCVILGADDLDTHKRLIALYPGVMAGRYCIGFPCRDSPLCAVDKPDSQTSGNGVSCMRQLAVIGMNYGLYAISPAPAGLEDEPANCKSFEADDLDTCFFRDA